MKRFIVLKLFFLFIIFYIYWPLSVLAENNLEINDNGLRDIWPMMSASEKRQFISGYLYAWKEARDILLLTKDFINKNSKKGAESLDTIIRLYDFRRVDIDKAVKAIDEFFNDSANSKKPISSSIIPLR